ncbi:hypothetical protein [Xanthomonas phage FMYAK-P1]|uniref:Uncharacterized protein n=1 Tax=Xanthomonas phage FMYAK-P1 TaxID=2886031 RepID=A0AAE8YLM4_9CAUD|nr:hypothetical protein P9A50_gp77 [Xanthomonas phage FMYAK-P1]UGL62791.1 hypothetical protein [Xanthomonas phage FMYAK-P1]
MDVNSFMEQSLANQAKQNSLLEAILDVLKDMNDNGLVIANVDGDPVQVAVIGAINNAVTTAGTTTKEAAGKAAVRETKKAAEAPPAETQVAETAQETPPAAEPEAAPPKGDKKKVTIDDARAALKKYAAIEGNDAAMDLLTSLNAKSVSDLAEQGPDALQKLIDKADGKSV